MIIAIRTRYGKNSYRSFFCWQEIGFRLAFQRELIVVVKLGVARSSSRFWY